MSLAYQPVFDLTAGHLVGFEAFARLTSADGTSISPAAFIPVAEDTGLIVGLGATVLDLGLAADETSSTIVRAIAGLTAELRLTCAIEGVETTTSSPLSRPASSGRGHLLARPTRDLSDVVQPTPLASACIR